MSKVDKEREAGASADDEEMNRKSINQSEGIEVSGGKSLLATWRDPLAASLSRGVRDGAFGIRLVRLCALFPSLSAIILA